ncbi:MAG: hypothetical protein NT027_09205 [Proteobacteria bacterium]|nr:hypothetical protein [Pseudomonadota bacterium]
MYYKFYLLYASLVSSWFSYAAVTKQSMYRWNERSASHGAVQGLNHK